MRSAVRYAAAVGRPVRVLSTGHGSLSRGAMDDALLIPVWRDWAESAPRETTTNLRLLNLPELPHLPAQLAGQHTVAVSGTAHAAAADLDTVARTVVDLIEPLRAVTEPTLNTWRPATIVEVLHTQMDPESPIPVHGSHRLLDALPDATVEKSVDTTGPGSQSPLMVVELRQLGGAFVDPLRSGGAFDRVDSPWLYYAAGVAFDAAASEAIAGQFTMNNAVLAAHTTPHTVPSFAEDAAEHQQSFGADTARRVSAVRQSYDPDGLFRGAVAVGSTHALSVGPQRGFRNLYHDLQETSSNAPAQD